MLCDLTFILLLFPQSSLCKRNINNKQKDTDVMKMTIWQNLLCSTLCSRYCIIAHRWNHSNRHRVIFGRLQFSNYWYNTVRTANLWLAVAAK